MTTSRLRAVVSIGGEVSRTLPTSARRAATELDRLAQAQANDRREAQRLRLEMRSLSRSSQAYARATEQQRELRQRMAERGVQIRDLSQRAGQATGILGRFGATVGRLGPWGAAAGAGLGIASGAIYAISSAINSEAAAARRIEDVAISTGASEDEVYRLGRGLQTLTGDYDQATQAAAGYLTAQGRIRRALAGQGDLGFAVELAYAGLTPEQVVGDLDDVAAAVRARLEAGVGTDVITVALEAAGYGEAASLVVALARDQERLNAAMAAQEGADLGDVRAYDEWRESSAALTRELGELRRDGVEGLTAAITPAVGGLAHIIDATAEYRQSSRDLTTAIEELRAAREASADTTSEDEQAAAALRLAAAQDAYTLAQRRATQAGQDYRSMLGGVATGLLDTAGIWTERDQQVIDDIVGGFEAASEAAGGLINQVGELPGALEGIGSTVIDELSGPLDWLGRQMDRLPGIDVGPGTVEHGAAPMAAPDVPAPEYGPIVPPDIAARLQVEDVAAPDVPAPEYGPIVPPDIAARLQVEDVAAPRVPAPEYGPIVPPDIAARLRVEDVAAPDVPAPEYGPIVPPDIAARLRVEDVAAPDVPAPEYGPIVPPDIAARIRVEDVAAPDVPAPEYGPIVPPDIAARIRVEDVAAPDVPAPEYGPIVPPDIAARIRVEDVAAPQATRHGIVLDDPRLTDALDRLVEELRRESRPGGDMDQAAQARPAERRIEQTNTYQISGVTDLDAALRAIEESTMRQVEELA